MMKTHEKYTNRDLRRGTAGAKEQELLNIKIRNAALKKLYENKMASLADRSLTPRLLRMMCQDVPVEAGNLESERGRKWFVRKCMRHYRNKLREIERSEKNWFIRLFC